MKQLPKLMEDTANEDKIMGNFTSWSACFGTAIFKIIN